MMQGIVTHDPVTIFLIMCMCTCMCMCMCMCALQCGHGHVYVRVAVRCSVVMIMCTSARYASLLDDTEGYTHDHVRIQCGEAHDHGRTEDPHWIRTWSCVYPSASSNRIMRQSSVSYRMIFRLSHDPVTLLMIMCMCTCMCMCMCALQCGHDHVCIRTLCLFVRWW